MPVTAPKAVRVRTTDGWVDVALVGPPGPAGADGMVDVYEQPNTPPVNAAIGSVWIDTDAPTPQPGVGPTGPQGAIGPKGDTGETGGTMGAANYRSQTTAGQSVTNTFLSIDPRVAGVVIEPAGAFVENTDKSVSVTEAGWYDIALEVATVGAYANGLHAGLGTAVNTYDLALGTSVGTSIVGAVVDVSTTVRLTAGQKIFVTAYAQATVNCQVKYLAISRVGGPQGVGVPVGGTIGQALVKKTGSNYDTEWGVAGAPPEVLVGPSQPTGTEVIWVDTDEPSWAGPPIFVTALPTSPVDGMEVYFQNAAMATDGIVWHLRYRAASASTYKWEFVGGQPLHTMLATDTNLAGNVNWQAVGNPTIVLPFTGDWDVEWGCHSSTDTGSLQAILAIGLQTTDSGGTLTNPPNGNPASDPRIATRRENVASNWAPLYRRSRLTAIKTQILMVGFTNQNNGHFSDKWLSVWPVRVG